MKLLPAQLQLFGLTFAILIACTHPVQSAPPESITIASEPGVEEGEMTTLIKKDGKVISKISGARYVSTSPDGKFVLLAEAAADDDTRHFLLNIGKGEYSKEGKKRLDYVIGGRYVVKANWSADGKTLTLISAEGLGEDEVIDLSKH